MFPEELILTQTPISSWYSFHVTSKVSKLTTASWPMFASGSASMHEVATDLVVFACSQHPLQNSPSLQFHKRLLPWLAEAVIFSASKRIRIQKRKILIYVIGQDDSQFHTVSRFVTSFSWDNISEVHISAHQISIIAWCEMNVIYCISFPLKCTARHQFMEYQYLP